MRQISLQLITILCITLTTSPTVAQTASPWIPVDARKLCNTTEDAFKQLQEGAYEPAITSQINSSLLTVWVNTKREVMVTTTVSVPNANTQPTSLTCIVAVGAENTWLNPDVFDGKSERH